MGHTNSTTNYNLPQFLTSDKPAWLTDINNAFSDIDTAVHNAQSDATTAGNNATQALSDASAASTAAATADGKGAGALASIAPAFDSTTIYSEGQYVVYNSLLYVCILDVVTPGPWTGVTNWSRVTLDSLVGNLENLVTVNKSNLVGALNETFGEVSQLFAGVTEAEKNSITPSSGSNYNAYGNTWYVKRGRLVWVHIGMQNLTPNTSMTVTSMPVQTLPPSIVCAAGTGGSSPVAYSQCTVDTAGLLKVASTDTYALADLIYFAKA